MIWTMCVRNLYVMDILKEIFGPKYFWLVVWIWYIISASKLDRYILYYLEMHLNSMNLYAPPFQITKLTSLEGLLILPYIHACCCRTPLVKQILIFFLILLISRVAICRISLAIKERYFIYLLLALKHILSCINYSRKSTLIIKIIFQPQ